MRIYGLINSGDIDLKESCTTEEGIIAVVGDGGWFCRVNEVAVHSPVAGQKDIDDYFQAT